MPKFNGDEGESALAEHHIQEHGGEAADFRMSIINREGGYVLGKCLEAVEIHLRDPILNRRMEGSGAMGLYFGRRIRTKLKLQLTVDEEPPKQTSTSVNRPTIPTKVHRSTQLCE